MSQSETLMLVVLGFALAFIVVLLFGRLAWNIALKLGARRNQRELPANVLELQAERDRLRAEQAMLSRKLELRLEDVKMRMAEQMAEVSRNRNRVEIMMKEIATRDDTIRQHDTEIARIKSLNKNLEIELSARADLIDRLGAENRAKDVEITKLSGDMIKVSASLREKNAKIVNLGSELETSVRLAAGVAATVAPGDETTEDRIRRRIAELTSISTQLSTAQAGTNPDGSLPAANDHPAVVAVPPAGEGKLVKLASSTDLQTEVLEEALEEKLAYAERQTQELDAELKRLDEVWSDKLQVIQNETATAETPAPAEAPKKRGGLNVISLAQRIRALQRGIGE